MNKFYTCECCKELVLDMRGIEIEATGEVLQACSECWDQIEQSNDIYNKVEEIYNEND